LYLLSWNDGVALNALQDILCSGEPAVIELLTVFLAAHCITDGGHILIEVDSLATLSNSVFSDNPTQATASASYQ